MTRFNLALPMVDLCERPRAASLNTSTDQPGRLAHGPDEKLGHSGLIDGFCMACPLLFEYTYLMQVLTFVTPRNDKSFDDPIRNHYRAITVNERIEAERGRAVQWVVNDAVSKDILDDIRSTFQVDVFQQDLDHAPYKLFLADMDSTIVQGETLDDMASKAGIGDQIATITAHAMAGEIDFEGALKERVALLANMPQAILYETLDELQLNEGAERLLSHLKHNNVHCVLISGGFTAFTEKVAEKLGFDRNFGNQLDVQNGLLTGKVHPPILDKAFKRDKLLELVEVMNIESKQTIAIGDGANDLPMLQTAGIGVGYYPKPLLRDQLINRIEYTDLSALMYIL